jgi:hypothetical protein
MYHLIYRGVLARTTKRADARRDGRAVEEATMSDCGCGDANKVPSDGTAALPAAEVQLHAEAQVPVAAALGTHAEELLSHPMLIEHLDGTEHRLLSMHLVDEEGSAKRVAPCAPQHFEATIYDYTNNRVVEARGAIANLDRGAPDQIEVCILGHQPLPSRDEFAAAVEIVRHDRELRAQIDDGLLQTYTPMPPLVDIERPDGRRERVVTVGLRTTNPDEPHHELVGVNMFDRQILRDLPGVVRDSDTVCEPPPGTDNCPSTGHDGQVWITVTQGDQTLWRFLAVRPAASGGTNGSGVELRYLDYRGKRVLYRAHVPILNVEYESDGIGIGCGPTYRDWQNQETCFQADGTDVIPGVRLCSTPAKTILDSGTDSGNFRGLAIYVDGPEVVLVSEMQAGWYRYISEWRLHANGTIRPRFGFAGTQNPCTCHTHVHHVYWRLDFDIRTAGHNTVEEFNDPPIFAGSNWHTKTFEIRRPRDAGRSRRWRVKNALSGEAYTLIPGPTDGLATPYGVGDLWVLRYKSNEIDDGQGFSTDPATSRARIDNFLNPPEPVTDTDVVLWYAAHFAHDHAHESGALIGPSLVPSQW